MSSLTNSEAKDSVWSWIRDRDQITNALATIYEYLDDIDEAGGMSDKFINAYNTVVKELEKECMFESGAFDWITY